MALFYQLPSDLLSFPTFSSYYPRRPIVSRSPTTSAPFERPQPVCIKKRLSGELQLEENGEEGWTAQVALPGVQSINDITLELQDEVLYVRSQSKNAYQRTLGTHTLQLPEGVEKRHISAVFSKGVLKIRLPKPKKPEEKPEAVKKMLANKLEIPADNIFSIWQRLQGPRISSNDNETHHVFKLEFPEGVNKKHLNIEVNRGHLNVTAHKKDEHSTFSFKRSITLPKNVSESDITAKFEGKCLEVTYPKAINQTEDKSFKVQISDTSLDHSDKVNSEENEPKEEEVPAEKVAAPLAKSTEEEESFPNAA